MRISMWNKKRGSNIELHINKNWFEKQSGCEMITISSSDGKTIANMVLDNEGDLVLVKQDGTREIISESSTDVMSNETVKVIKVDRPTADDPIRVDKPGLPEGFVDLKKKASTRKSKTSAPKVSTPVEIMRTSGTAKAPVTLPGKLPNTDKGSGMTKINISPVMQSRVDSVLTKINK